MKITITTAGRAALVNLPNTGTNAVKIVQTGVTATAFVPNPGMTSLPGEVKRLSTMSGEAVADDTIHATIRDYSADTYTVRGVGMYLEDGTLFAVYGQASAIMEKSAQASLLMALDVIFADIDANLITFGDANFLNPPATTEVQGVVELATLPESEAGDDATRAVTPRGLKAFIDKRFGGSAPTALAKNLLSIASAIAFRAALEIKSAALKDEGTGNGLDADLLDGQHGDFYRDYRNLTSVPSEFNPKAHPHAIGDVDGLQAALNAKATINSDASFTNLSGVLHHRYGYFNVSSYSQTYGAGMMRTHYDANGATWYLTGLDGEGVIKPLTIKVNGNTVYHAGNFDPATKVNLAGDTMSGMLRVERNVPALSGVAYGNGHAEFKTNDGSFPRLGFHRGAIDAAAFVYRGGHTFAVVRNTGDTFDFWHSGNFDPGSRVVNDSTGTNGVGLGWVNGSVRVRIDASAWNLWHNGNFDPNTKATNGANVSFRDVAADRGNGTGAVFLGPQGSGRYLFFNGSSYELGGAGTIYHTGNLNLATKVDRTEYSNSAGQNGWMRRPDGMIEQWGYIVQPKSGEGAWSTITFPMAFPQVCLNVTTTDICPSDMYHDLYSQVIQDSVSRTQFRIYCQRPGNGDVNWRGMYWRAIGY